jgi:hypothetical protein
VSLKTLRLSQTNKINLKKYQPKKKEKNMNEEAMKKAELITNLLCYENRANLMFATGRWYFLRLILLVWLILSGFGFTSSSSFYLVRSIFLVAPVILGF